jgi:hypothetical protein
MGNGLSFWAARAARVLSEEAMMRRVIVGLMAISLLAFAGPVQAQDNGTGDPLGLISSAAIQPFWAEGGNFTIIEITSPVGFNSLPETPNLHAIYFNAACNRSVSEPFPLTQNGMRLLSPDISGASFNGLAVLAGSLNNINLIPMANPIHVKGHWFNFALDSARVVDPISLHATESLPVQTWNPLRSGADWINPVQGGDFATTIYLVCPDLNITRDVLPTISGFPPAPPIASSVTGIIYNDDEEKLRDIFINCDCLTTVPLLDIIGGNIYADASQTVDGFFYTEIFTSGAAFTGYKATVDITGDFPVFGDFFSRLHNGSWQAIGAGINSPGVR